MVVGTLYTEWLHRLAARKEGAKRVGAFLMLIGDEEDRMAFSRPYQEGATDMPAGAAAT